MGNKDGCLLFIKIQFLVYISTDFSYVFHVYVRLQFCLLLCLLLVEMIHESFRMPFSV